MRTSTKSMLWSFVPLSGFLASKGMSSFWLYMGYFNLILAFWIATIAILERIKEYYESDS